MKKSGDNLAGTIRLFKQLGPLKAPVTSLLLAGFLLAASGGAQAQDDQEDLAKKSQNPLGDVISFTFDSNLSFGNGPEDGVQYTNDLRLVLPTAIGDWTLINRSTLPVIYQEERFEGEGDESGLGDFNYQGFFVPPLDIPVTLGLGPSILMPTHTDKRLGSDKWSAGPAAVIVAKPGNWLFGSLIQNLWSFAGDSDAQDVNLFSWQYFINYNLDDGWYLTSTPTITANWEADSDDRWTVPVGGGIGKLVRFGNQPVDFKLQGFWNAEKPDQAADGRINFQVKFLFPK